MQETISKKNLQLINEGQFDRKQVNNNEAQKYLKHYSDLGKLKESSTEKANEMLVKNIEHYRNFYTQLAGISLVTIAAILQVLSQGQQTIFKTIRITWLGTLLLALSSICNIFYLTYLISNENILLNKKKNFYIRTFEEEIKNTQSFVNEQKPFSEYQDSYLNNMLNYVEEEKQINSQNWLDKSDFYVKWGITITFILGFVLAVISFFVIKIIR